MKSNQNCLTRFQSIVHKSRSRWKFRTKISNSAIHGTWSKVLLNITNYMHSAIVIRNGKHGPSCWYFRLYLEFLGWPYSEYIKTANKGCFQWGFLIADYFETVLAIFSCMNMVQTFLRQLRRSLQMEKIVTNAACALQFAP